MKIISDNYTVIVADGSFPVHPVPQEYIANAQRIICCDGSTSNLINAGYLPFAIVGDMDSLDEEIALRFADRIFMDDDQETNDLTKSVMWCINSHFTDIVIVGATGKREDHTIGNISLLAEYSKEVNIIMVTDTGIFIPLRGSKMLSSFCGQQVSIFSIDPETEISSSGLKYPLIGKKLNNWWVATLNEAIGDSFSLEFNNGRVIVYLKFSQ
jgi:thiamine pyrophosphokinase